MKYVKPIGDSSEVNHPAYAMSLRGCPYGFVRFVFSVWIETLSNMAVSMYCASYPLPTSVCFANVLPESSDDAFRKSLRDQIRKISFVVHTWFKLRVCRAIDRFSGAMASLFLTFQFGGCK